MSEFPRTAVGGLSLSRMIIGTNWFLGFSHCTRAKDQLINDSFRDYRKVADVLEVFLAAGVDTIMGLIARDTMYHGIQEAQQRTGKRMTVVSTPAFKTTPRTPVDGFEADEIKRVLDIETERGAAICMPHTTTTDIMLDKCTRTLRHMDQLCAAIRERGMVPGLSTHVPETILYADESGLDVETYISLFNAMGFLMQVEVDWTRQVIRRAAKPVMTIKSMAAGQLRPLQALTFSWNAIRDCDMVTVGTMTPAEAQELIDLSLEILEGRASRTELQKTRSKATLEASAADV